MNTMKKMSAVERVFASRDICALLLRLVSRSHLALSNASCLSGTMWRASKNDGDDGMRAAWSALSAAIPRGLFDGGNGKSHMGMRRRVLRYAAVNLRSTQCDRCPSDDALELTAVGLRLCGACRVKHLIPLEAAIRAVGEARWRRMPCVWCLGPDGVARRYASVSRVLRIVDENKK
jgi:hypothetical protein